MRTSMSQIEPDNTIELRAAVALRAARTGLGWSQETAAQKSGLAKTTIARIETLVGQITLANIFQLIETYANHGVDIADLKLRKVQVTFADQAFLEAGLRITNPDRKRSDMGKSRKLLANPTEDKTGE